MTKDEAIVYVVDDDGTVRKSLQSLIHSAGMQTLTFSSHDAFLKERPAETSACLILDLRFPTGSGLDVQRAIRFSGRPLPIIFITGQGDISASVSAMKAGAIEFFTKPFQPSVLLKAIRDAVERDRRYLRKRAELAEWRRRYNQLTERERQIMRFVTQGALNKQIAAELGKSEITIKVQRGRMMRKMNAISVADLVRVSTGLESGLPDHVRL